MSIAAETRAAVRDRPFLLDALRAGVLNYAAAARRLDVSEDTEAVAAALRRFERELDDHPAGGRSAAVRMESGLAETDPGDALLRVGTRAYAPDGGDYTGIVATDDIDPSVLEAALGVCRSHDIEIRAAGVSTGTLVVVVGRADGPAALRYVETALAGPAG